MHRINFCPIRLGCAASALLLAAGELQRDGLIPYSLGDITVLDRARLEAASCSYYAAASFAGALVSAMYGR